MVMDMIKFTQLYNLVKMGVPTLSSSIELKRFMQEQDQERQAWFENADLAEIADWLVATMRQAAAKAKGVDPILANDKGEKSPTVSKIKHMLNSLGVADDKQAIPSVRDAQCCIFSGSWRTHRGSSS